MKKHLATILPALVASALVAGCTGRSSSTATTLTPQPEETQSESTPQQRPHRRLGERVPVALLYD